MAKAAERQRERLWRHFKEDGPADARDCYMEVVAFESSLFSLELPDALSTVYNSRINDNEALLLSPEDARRKQAQAAAMAGLSFLRDKVAFRLFSAVLALNESPYIRASSSDAAKTVAGRVAELLAKHITEHPEWAFWGKRDEDRDTDVRLAGRALRPNEPADRATLLIVDRVDDIAAALMHDGSYSGQLVELLHHRPCSLLTLKYKPKKDKPTFETAEIVLDEADPLWRNLRYEPYFTFVDAVRDLGRMLNERIDARHESQEGEEDIDKMRRQMRSLASGETDLDGKIRQHHRMKNATEARWDKRQMSEVIDLEQKLAMWCDRGGAAVKRSAIDDQMRTVLGQLRDAKREVDGRISSGAKLDADGEGLKRLAAALGNDMLRLVMLYALCSRAVDGRTMREFAGLAELTEDQKSTLANLVYLHVDAERRDGDALPRGAPPLHSKDVQRALRKRAEDLGEKTPFLAAPKLEDVVVQLLTNTLPTDDYPWFRAPPAPARGGAGGPSGSGTPGTSAAVAMHAGHGEVSNTLAADAIERVRAAADAGGAGAAAAAAELSRKRTKFPKGGAGAGAGGGGGGEGGAGGGGSGKEPDLYDIYLSQKAGGPRMYEGGRLIIFVVGGLTQAEAAAADRLAKKTRREVIIGGTSLLTPDDFLQQVFKTKVPEEDEFGLDDFDIGDGAAGTGAGAAGGAGAGAGAGTGAGKGGGRDRDFTDLAYAKASRR